VTEDVGLPAVATVTTDSLMLTSSRKAPRGFRRSTLLLAAAGRNLHGYTPQGDMFDATPSRSAAPRESSWTPAALSPSPAPGSRTAKRATGNVRNFQPLGYTYDGSLVPSSLFLKPGSFSIAGPGGADVGAISASFTFPTPLTWSDGGQTSASLAARVSP